MKAPRQTGSAASRRSYRAPLLAIAAVAAVVVAAGVWTLWYEARHSQPALRSADEIGDDAAVRTADEPPPEWIAASDPLSIEQELLELERQVPSPEADDPAADVPAAARGEESTRGQPADALASDALSNAARERVSSKAGSEARAAARRTADLSGTWHLATRIQSSSYGAYEGLRLGFRVQLQHDGMRVTGRGQKWTENGRGLPASARTPITLEGAIDNGRAELTFSETGASRSSRGTLDLALTDSGELRGTFWSDAARSRGTAYARRAR
jgi:hypothetical protein